MVEILQGLFYRPWIQMGPGKITDWSLWLSHEVLKKKKKVAQIHCTKVIDFLMMLSFELIIYLTRFILLVLHCLPRCPPAILLLPQTVPSLLSCQMHICVT